MKGVRVEVGLLSVAALLVVSLAGCGGAHARSTDIIQAGQIDIKLPPGWTVTAHGAAAPPSTAPPASTPVAANTPAAQSAAASPSTSPGSTIPLAKADPTTAFFQATSAFSSCLKQLGVKFIGAPDPKNPNSPANDPGYLKNLTTCAAQSHIVQALKDFQTSQANLTPAQIQQQNQGYLRWRDCMIGRGWTIPTPKPDSQGKLFSITGSNGVQLTPPAGQDVLTSGDVRQCAQQAQNAAPGGNGSGG